MPDNYVDITVRARGDAPLNLDELKAKLNDLGRKVETARVGLAGDKESLVTLDRMEAKLLAWGRRTETAKLKVDGVARAEVDIAGMDLALGRLGSKADTATAATGPAGLSGMSGMGALIAAGAALSPVIVTLGFGLGGLGAAAYGVIAPIEKAAKASGGLKANLHTLDPEQQAVARGLLGLGKQYDKFQQSLKPQVLGAFGQGLKIAGHLMSDIQPVAKATGNALDAMLGRIDKEFASGQWQSFFGFMARTAGPDVQLLSNNFIDLMKVLPALLTDLQPVARGLLQVTDDTVKLTGAVIKASEEEHKLAVEAQGSSGWLGRLAHATGQAVGQMVPGIPAAQKLWQEIQKQGNAAGKTAGTVGGLGDSAGGAAGQMNALAASVKNVQSAESHLSTALAYGNALVTQKNDAVAFGKAMDASHGKIGLNTQKQRDSFATANTYINDLIGTAKAAADSGKGVGAQARAIGAALPALEAAKGKTAAYRAELAALKSWYDRLRAEANIVKTVTIGFVTTGLGQPGGGGSGLGPGMGKPRPIAGVMSGVPGGPAAAGSDLSSSVMAAAAAAAAAVSAGALIRPHRAPWYGHEQITNQFIPSGPRQPYERPPPRITNGAELRRAHSRTHYGGSAQRAYGYGPG